MRCSRPAGAEEARDAFARAAAADPDGETDAADRLDELDGIEFEDLADYDDEDLAETEDKDHAETEDKDHADHEDKDLAETEDSGDAAHDPV